MLGLLPSFLFSSKQPVLPKQIVCIEPNGLRLVVPNNPKSQSGEASRGEVIPVPEMMRRLSGGGGKAKPELGLRLPYQACFVRRVELPSAAMSDFPQLLALDLERATPFKAKDVRTAYTVDTASNRAGKVSVRHFVIKRSAVDGIIATLESAGRKVARLDCWAEDGASALPVNFLDEISLGSGAPRQSAILPKVLTATAAGLAGMAAYLVIDHSETALLELQAQTTRLKTKVQATRDAAARSQTLMADIENFRRLRATMPSKVAALEELTRLFPDTAWVTDLKIDGSNVDIAGLASSAVTLIPILERSAFFVDANSTAPLTFDQREDKERFSLRVKIRSAATAEAARPPEAPK